MLHLIEQYVIRINYICVASDSLPKETLVLTSLGMGKVYDTGVGNSYTIDIYTNW